MPYIIPWGTAGGGNCPGQYTAFNINCGITPTAGIKEKGTTILSSELRVNITKGSENITSIQFLRNGSVIYSPTGGISNGGTFTYTELTPITDTTTFSVRVSDGMTTRTCTNTYEFIHPIFMGPVVDRPPVSSIITGLNKQLVKPTVVSHVYNGYGTYVGFFVPATEWSPLSRIQDENGFTITNLFEVLSVNVDVNPGALNVPYRAYINWDIGIWENYTFTFTP